MKRCDHRCRNAWIAAIACLVLATADRANGAETAAPRHTPEASRAGVSSLIARRGEMAAALAAQAAYCSARRDTGHPAFHGCIDWHSAVHGAWALAAFLRMTGDPRHRAQLDRILDPALLAEELKFVREHPRFEMPYGRAWLLRLATTWRALEPADKRLDALAAEAADSLLRLYENDPPNPRRGDYENPSWALLNLRDHARSRDDAVTTRRVDAIVRAHLLAPRCDLELEARGFLAVCVTWAWLVSAVLPRDEFRAWYARWNPGLETLAPVRSFATAHDYGRNFSRAWGLHPVAVASGDARLIDLYARHVAAGYTPASQWRGDYAEVGHWVAQFGILAITPLFEKDAR